MKISARQINTMLRKLVYQYLVYVINVYFYLFILHKCRRQTTSSQLSYRYPVGSSIKIIFAHDTQAVYLGSASIAYCRLGHKLICDVTERRVTINLNIVED